MHLPQHRHNLRAQPIQIGVDGRQVARGIVFVEVAVEGDLVADAADLPVAGVTLAGVDPGIGHMGEHFTAEIGVDVFFERYIFCVT